jgi:hypothetical protein
MAKCKHAISSKRYFYSPHQNYCGANCYFYAHDDFTGIGDTKQLGRIGTITIFCFEVISTVAIILGITFSNVSLPGNCIDI